MLFSVISNHPFHTCPSTYCSLWNPSTSVGIWNPHRPYHCQIWGVPEACSIGGSLPHTQALIRARLYIHKSLSGLGVACSSASKTGSVETTCLDSGICNNTSLTSDMPANSPSKAAKKRSPFSLSVNLCYFDNSQDDVNKITTVSGRFGSKPG